MHPLIPLLILFLFLVIAGVVGFVIYSIATDIASKTSEKMERHNVTVGPDGLKIGVKEIKNEDYVGRTQDVLVKAWNLSTWPAYKSRFWNKKENAKQAKSKSKSVSASKQSPRQPAVGSSSGSSKSHTGAQGHRIENGGLAAPMPSVKRTPSGHALPGSFD